MQIFDPPPVRPPRRLRLPGMPPLSRLVPGFARRPLAWVIAAETLVTAAFLLAALHLLSSALPAPAAAAAPLALLPSAPPNASPPSVGALVGPATGSPSPVPGLNRGGGFLGGLISGLNQDQAAFEHQEWSALKALAGAIRTYIEGVMVPAVEKATHSARSP